MRSTIGIAAAITLGFAATTSVFAASYTIETYPSRDKCFAVKHIPATVQVNTMGTLVQGESNAVVGSYAPGGTVIFRKNPAVYIETRKVLEQDHISLVPTSC